MTEAEAEEAIRQRWVDGWLPLQPSVPFTFENEVLEAPATWARVTIAGASRAQRTLGAVARFESAGLIVVELFGELNVGTHALALLADDVREVLERRRIGTPADVVTYEGTSRPAGSHGRWHKRIVTIRYTVDEQRPGDG